MWDPAPWPHYARYGWVHFQSYHLVRHHGETMPSFTFIESMPVHYKAEKRPPRAPVASEWSPQNYRVDLPWAGYFDTVLVRAPSDVDDPKELAFKDAADEVRVIARKGRYWLFDASRATHGRER